LLVIPQRVASSSRCEARNLVFTSWSWEPNGPTGKPGVGSEQPLLRRFNQDNGQYLVYGLSLSPCLPQTAENYLNLFDSY